jgi:hypothetical protein
MSHRDTDGRTTSGTSAQELKEALDGARRLAPRGVPKRLSYQAFMKLLVRHSASLVMAVMLALRGRMQQEFSEQFRIAGLIPMAVDGSHVQLPRTLSNEERFSPRKTRKTGKNKNKRRGERPKTKQARQQRSRDKKADLPPLERGGVLPALQADLRSGQAPQPQGGTRRMRDAVVAAGLVDDAAVRSSPTAAVTRSERISTSASQRGQSAACVRPGPEPYRQPSANRQIPGGTAPTGGDRLLPTWR